MITFIRHCLIIIGITRLLYPGYISAQDKQPQLTFLGRWDNDQLRSIGKQTFNSLWGWTSSQGREYAVMGSTDSIYFFDVTDPRRPKLCDVEAGRDSYCVHREFQTYSHYAYAIADEWKSSLQVFDLSYLPDSVHKVYDSDTIFQRAHDLFIEGKTLYIAHPVLKNKSVRAFAALSLDDPERPTLISFLDPKGLFSYVHEATVIRDTAWLSCADDGMFIYDYRDKQSPRLISSITRYPRQGFNHSSCLSDDGNTLFSTDENTGQVVKIFDVRKLRKSRNAEPDFITTCGIHDAQGSVPHNPYIIGKLLILSYYEDGVVLFDVSDPSHPIFLSQYDTYPQNGLGYSDLNGCWHIYPFFKSGTIIASDQSNGLFTLKIDSVVAVNEVPAPVLQGIRLHYSAESHSLRLLFLPPQMIGRPYELLNMQAQQVGTGLVRAEIALPEHLPAGMYLIRMEGWSGKFFLN